MSNHSEARDWCPKCSRGFSGIFCPRCTKKKKIDIDGASFHEVQIDFSRLFAEFEMKKSKLSQILDVDISYEENTLIIPEGSSSIEIPADKYQVFDWDELCSYLSDDEVARLERVYFKGQRIKKESFRKSNPLECAVLEGLILVDRCILKANARPDSPISAFKKAS